MLTTSAFPYDLEPKTKHGIDKLELMLQFISLIEGDSDREAEGFSKMKSWLSQKIKRELTPQEVIALSEGIIKYIRSEPITNEREEAMRYLFEAEFLADGPVTSPEVASS